MAVCLRSDVAAPPRLKHLSVVVAVGVILGEPEVKYRINVVLLREVRYVVGTQFVVLCSTTDAGAAEGAEPNRIRVGWSDISSKG